MQEKAARRMREISYFGVYTVASYALNSCPYIHLMHSGLLQLEPRYAPALKQTHEESRRGGESIARLK